MKRVSVLNQSNGRGGVKVFHIYLIFFPSMRLWTCPYLSLFLPYWNQSQRKEEEEKADHFSIQFVCLNVKAYSEEPIIVLITTMKILLFMFHCYSKIIYFEVIIVQNNVT